MMKHTYIFNGDRYKRTKKDVAERKILANPELKFFMVGANVNDNHFHKGWFLATHIDNLNVCRKRNGIGVREILGDKIMLQHSYNNFNFYLDRELGKYPVYYVQQA